LKIAGGNIGIEALRELEHKSLGKLNIIESLVDSETYTKSQQYMTDWIKEAGQVRVKSLVNNSMLKSRFQKSAEAEAKKGKVLNLATGKWEDE
jgi:sensor histidine kinase regulating citrate/malate metabolism